MSRAFIKENDGWEFCLKIQDTCWFAREDGSCPLKKCIHDKEDEIGQDKAETGEKPESDQQGMPQR